MSKLFKPFPVPGAPQARAAAALQARREEESTQRLKYMLGRSPRKGFGRFVANFFDGRSQFHPDTDSRRWRLVKGQEELGRIHTGVYFRDVYTKQRGHWIEIAEDEDFAKVGEAPFSAAMPIPFGSGTYRDINVRFWQMAGFEFDVKLPKPVEVIVEDTPLGPLERSVIQNKVELPAAGFMKAPPPSHVLDPEVGSPTFGQWIDPVGGESTIATPPAEPNYFDTSSKLHIHLKPGLSHMRVWCPSGEYREFDTSDTTNYKVTAAPVFESPEISMPIKIGKGVGTQWDIYLYPRRTQISVEFWHYYAAFTAFTYFQLGIHHVRNQLTRLPLFPVPYGYNGGEFDDIFFASDWVYYVSQWHGAFSPSFTSAHPRPVGFDAAGGEEGFNPALLPNPELWEGPAAHGSDYSLEYALAHGVLPQVNPHDFEVFNVFFAIVYLFSSPVSYFARLARQQPGDLCAKIMPKKRNGELEQSSYYVWQKTQHTISPIRTLNTGALFYDWDNPDLNAYQLKDALERGGWR